MAKKKKIEVEREVVTRIDGSEGCSFSVFKGWDENINISMIIQDGATRKVWRFKVTSENARKLQRELSEALAESEVETA